MNLVRKWTLPGNEFCQETDLVRKMTEWILPGCQHKSVCIADTDLEAEVDPSVETEEKLRAEEQAARQRLEAMQRCANLIG